MASSHSRWRWQGGCPHPQHKTDEQVSKAPCSPGAGIAKSRKVAGNAGIPNIKAAQGSPGAGREQLGERSSGKQKDGAKEQQGHLRQHARRRPGASGRWPG